MSFLRCCLCCIPRRTTTPEPPEQTKSSGDATTPVAPVAAPVAVAALVVVPPEPGFPYSDISKENLQIRLVTLKPGSWTEEIDCAAHVVRFDSRPVYEALSYVWGYENMKRPIRLNDCDFDVTENLWLALRRLRSPSTARVLWVNAICINQTDKKEKSHHVGMMGEIFKRCKSCTIWLGESLDATNAGTQTVGLAQACELLSILSANKHLPDLPCFSVVEGQRTDISAEYEAHFEALKQLLDLPWWRRIWVVQELVLPAHVIFLYASQEIPYQTILGVVDMLKTHAATCCKRFRMTLCALAFDPLLTVQEQVDPLISTRETWAKREGVSLFKLRRRFYAFQATNKRDLFYGLLGLVTEWPSTPLEPNYSASTRVVFTETAFKYVSEQGGVEFLLGERLFRAEEKEEVDMPTWVPDAYFCSLPRQWVIVEQRRLRIYDFFSAFGSRSQEASELALGETGVLSTQSLAVDKICRVGPVCDALENFSAAPDVLRKWMEMLDLQPGRWPEQPLPKDSAMDVLWRTMLNDTVEADTEGLSYQTAGEADYAELRTLWALLLSPLAFSFFRIQFSDEAHDVLMSKAPKTLYHILVCLWQRRLFVTESGRVGLAPRDAGVGDEVHIVLGSPAPFILRRVSESDGVGDGAGSYTVIGNGYMHAVMRGEALENEGDGAVRAITIH